MVTRTYTVAFQGVEARLVEVQCAVSPGLPSFGVVGLPDKAVSEARDRVRSALSSMAIALPSKRITVNLSPAESAENTLALGELSLDGTLVPWCRCLGLCRRQ